jgi:membrane-bound ClpP family serine protease
MTLIVLLFAIGILLIALEVIVPGAVLGTIGAVMIFGGCVMAFLEFGTGGGILALVAAFIIGGIALFVEFRLLPKTKIGKRAFLTKEITAVSQAIDHQARNLIGKTAESLTMLSPSGYVRVDGQRFEAFCQSGQAPVGTALHVIGADNFRLIVSEIKPTHPNHHA